MVSVNWVPLLTVTGAAATGVATATGASSPTRPTATAGTDLRTWIRDVRNMPPSRFPVPHTRVPAPAG
ncbi:hypothetical protein GCM10022225_38740 [Plantactinospora mayteni]|uniref:Secreted protein n=1 Tax=Plantactinospora mayteni TaxID=566021 RepID=A0ABQ4EWQ3_9ACTN|nr:hypothetical protein Pma05_56800 [Plantactinospora mayteni]